jgi:hypothetical protein
MTTFTERIDKIDEVIKKLEVNRKLEDLELKSLRNLVKEIKKNYNTDFKKKGTKTKKTESNGDSKKYGITEPKVLPPNVYEFIKYTLTNNKLADEFVNNNNDIFENFTIETLVARTKVNSIIHNYIKTNNLYVDEEKRSVYKPDAKLKELFEMKDTEDLNLKNIQTFLKRAYDKFKTDDPKKDKKQKKEEKEEKEESEEVEVEDETENDSD